MALIFHYHPYDESSVLFCKQRCPTHPLARGAGPVRVRWKKANGTSMSSASNTQRVVLLCYRMLTVWKVFAAAAPADLLILACGRGLVVVVARSRELQR